MCIVDETCESPILARGACRAHYKRAHRSGDLSVLAPAKPPGSPRVTFVVDGFKSCSACGQSKSVDDFHRDESHLTGYRSSCRTCEKHMKMARIYGLSQAQYEAMYDQQGALCAICRCPEGEAGAKGFHVDHDHETGQVRGLLCSRCNTGIGHFGDDPERLIAASAYLIRASDLAESGN